MTDPGTPIPDPDPTGEYPDGWQPGPDITVIQNFPGAIIQTSPFDEDQERRIAALHVARDLLTQRTGPAGGFVGALVGPGGSEKISRNIGKLIALSEYVIGDDGDTWVEDFDVPVDEPQTVDA